MRLEEIGSSLVNPDHIEQIYCETDAAAVTKTYDETTQTVSSSVVGNPYKIVFCLISGKELRLEYKLQADRDNKFLGLKSVFVR